MGRDYRRGLTGARWRERMGVGIKGSRINQNYQIAVTTGGRARTRDTVKLRSFIIEYKIIVS
jgi:hypothetical protein